MCNGTLNVDVWWRMGCSIAVGIKLKVDYLFDDDYLFVIDYFLCRKMQGSKSRFFWKILLEKNVSPKWLNIMSSRLIDIDLQNGTIMPTKSLLIDIGFRIWGHKNTM